MLILVRSAASIILFLDICNNLYEVYIEKLVFYKLRKFALSIWFEHFSWNYEAHFRGEKPAHFESYKKASKNVIESKNRSTEL